MSLWYKYLLKKIVKNFGFFLFSLFFIYVVVDLSAHGVRFFSKSSFWGICLFYLNAFSSLLDLFFTLSFILAVLRILFDLNQHKELLAFQMGGLSKKRLLHPFFIFAFFLSFLCYCNAEWVAPSSLRASTRFKKTHKKEAFKDKIPSLFTAALEDESELVYQTFEKAEKTLFDVYWICDFQDVWHMQSLHVDSLEAIYADHFVRDKEGALRRLESFESKTFSNLPLQKGTCFQTFIPYESRSISTLLVEALKFPADSRILFSHLYYKLAAPLIFFLILIGVAPIAMQSKRVVPTFLIAAFSIFIVIGLKIILDGMLILGENLVLPSFFAIFSPLFFLFFCTFPRFMRCQ